MHLHVQHSVTGRLYRFASALWPYIAIGLLLPGGSMLALALWLYRRIRELTKLDRGDVSWNPFSTHRSIRAARLQSFCNGLLGQIGGQLWLETASDGSRDSLALAGSHGQSLACRYASSSGICTSCCRNRKTTSSLPTSGAAETRRALPCVHSALLAHMAGRTSNVSTGEAFLVAAPRQRARPVAHLDRELCAQMAKAADPQDRNRIAAHHAPRLYT
jgi:hypothetical protein